MISRRGVLVGLLAAPAIIRTPGLLMAVRPVSFSTDQRFGLEYGNSPSMDIMDDIAALLSKENAAMADMAWRQAPAVFRTSIATPNRRWFSLTAAS